MDREQVDEFYGVREAAYNSLRLGMFIERHRLIPVCQLLIFPSFENAVSWNVIRDAARGAQARLYRSCWRMDIDDRAFASPVERIKHPKPYLPTIQVDWMLIDASRVESILAGLRSTAIPLAIANPPFGADGTGFELAVAECFCNARIGWWCEMPEEWRELRPVVVELEQLFLKSWASRA